MINISPETLAIVFGGLTALSVLLYAILDGYDLGVGITLPMNNEAQRDTSIASIGPFWDANETWSQSFVPACNSSFDWFNSAWCSF